MSVNLIEYLITIWARRDYIFGWNTKRKNNNERINVLRTITHFIRIKMFTKAFGEKLNSI